MFSLYINYSKASSMTLDYALLSALSNYKFYNER